MKRTSRYLFFMLLTGFLIVHCGSGEQEQPAVRSPIVTNRPPLHSTPYTPLPLGAVKPQGWLVEQLRRMADGMSGHLDELYRNVGPENAWRGGDGDSWERGPYWLDGLIPLAWLLDDDALKAKAQPFIDWTLASQQADGFFGPADQTWPERQEAGIQRGNKGDWWPRMVMLKALQSYYEATGDARVIDLMTRYFHFQLATLPGTPLGHWTFWGRHRGGENLASIFWLYNRTGDAFLLDLARLVHEQTSDWTSLFLTGALNPPNRRSNEFRDVAEAALVGVPTSDAIRGVLPRLPFQGLTHSVNVAMAVKEPGVYSLLSGNPQHLQASEQAIADLTLYHGQANGVFSGNEWISSTDPTAGTEFCTVVEFMYSLETLLWISGRADIADRLERVAYNALPTHASKDYTGREYLQQVNQIRCAVVKTNQFTNGGERSDRLCYGLLTGYPCCTTNLHQGWPKFIEHLWLASDDGGLAALAYGPSEVQTPLNNGSTAHILEETQYPFDGRISFRIIATTPVEFPLHLRIPGWCQQAEIRINDDMYQQPSGGQIVRIMRLWKDDDTVTLDLPMAIQTSHWHNNSIAVERGPLVYALQIGEERKVIGGEGRYATREVLPTTPWNYALVADAENPAASFQYRENGSQGFPWETPPLQIQATGRRFVPWQEYAGVAGPLPYSLVESDAPEEQITLVPYGCTTLRIAAFPFGK